MHQSCARSSVQCNASTLRARLAWAFVLSALIALVVPSLALAVDAYEPDNADTSAKVITTDGVMQDHDIDPMTDIDWLKFTGRQGYRYTIQTQGGTTAPTVGDTVISAFGWLPTPTEYYIDDLSGAGYYSRLQFTALRSRTWYVEVRSYAGSRSGSYRVNVIESDPAAPVTTDNAPSGWRTTDTYVTLSASDAASGVQATYYTVDGGPQTTYTGAIGFTTNGVHSLRYWSTDRYGNTEAAKTVSVSIDKTAPVTVASAPSTWTSGTALMTLIPTDANSGTLWTWASIDSGPALLYTGVPIAFTQDGTYDVDYWSVDVAGNSETPKSLQIKVDNSAPVAADDAPQGWRSAPVTVTISATDPLSGVGRIDASVTAPAGGAMGSSAVGSSMMVPVSDEGLTTIVYSATDTVGNTSANSTATVRLDLTGPMVGITTDSAWSANPVAVSIAAFDALSGLDMAWYSVDGGAAYPTSGSFFVADKGEHVVEAWAFDEVGNESDHTTATVRIDKTAPTTNDNAPAGWQAGPIAVTLGASDSESGVLATLYQVGGGVVETYTAPINIAAEGATTISYWSVDAVGNFETPKTATVRIDRTGPVVTDDSSPDWQTGPVTVAFSAADAGVDSSIFHYSLDGSGEATTAASMAVSGTGVHELVYYGVDRLGNVGPASRATIRIDDQTPVSSSDIDSAWQQGPVDVTISATDAHAGVHGISANITDPSSVVTPMSVTSETMTFTVSAEGTSSVLFFATDEVGNMEIPNSAVLRVDNTLPIVSMTPTATAVIDAMTFTVDATDALSGVASVWCTVDGGSAVATDTVQLDTVGDHTIEYWAIDAAGNASAHGMRDVRVSPSQTDHVAVAGANRFDTAIAASQQTFPGGANAVIIATGANWPDALGGAALAGVYDAPVLLTRADLLPAAVVTEMVRLAPAHIYVLGGTNVVSESIEARLRALFPTSSVERFWGANRFATVESIAARVVRDSSSFDGTAFVATGNSFPDALAAAPLATALERPLYLADRSGLSSATIGAMLDAGVTDVVLLGGTGAVPSVVEAQLDDVSLSHTRLSGIDRYATALEITKSGVAAGLTWDKLAFACGTDFPDALAGGVMQGHDSSVMVLTECDTLDARVAAVLLAQRDIIGEVRYIGGPSAINQGVRDAVAQVLR